MNELQIYENNSLLGDFVSYETDRLTPDYYVEHYLEFLPKYIANSNPSKDTLKDYSTGIKIFIDWCKLHHAHPLALKDVHCRIYLDYMIEKNYSAATINLRIAAVKTFYNVALKLGLISENPCSEIKVKSPHSDESKIKFLTVQQIKYVGEKILHEPNEQLRYRNMAIFMLMTVEGLRTVEVHRMNDEDINFEMKTIYIRGKGHNDFIYPCEDTFRYIDEYLKNRPAVKKDGALTPTFISLSNFTCGQRISRMGIRWAVNQILTLCHLKTKNYSCHMLRHSCATNLYQATKDLRLVQDTLRHSSPAMTAKYAHVHDRMTKRQTGIISPFSNMSPE